MPILSPLQWIDRARKLAEKYPENVARVTRMYDEQPRIARVYSPLAIAQAAERSKPSQLVMLKPSEFKQLALPLPARQSAPYVKHYADLIRNGDWTEPDDPDIFTQKYLKRMRTQPYEGYSDLPFLQYKQGQGASGSIIGHEGRHRNLATQEVFPEEEFPVRFSETSRTDSLPENASIVYPELLYTSTEPVDLSSKTRFASGGAIKSALSAFKAIVHPATDAGQLAVRDALATRIAPGKFKAGNDEVFRRHMITDETMTNANSDPTTLFHDPDTNEVVGAYQLGERPGGMYIPNIVAYKKGLGHEMLQHAKEAAGDKKVYLYSIPGAEKTYRDPRQKAAGWTESSEDGIAMFTNERN